MNFENDTITAIATSLTPSGIGIIRLSGNKSIEIVNRLFLTKKNKHKLINAPSHYLNYGKIINPINNIQIDEVLVSVMRGPNSYTKEDVVEINVHGGIIVMQKILHILLNEGARLAEPGEFTKRAFLNGRIDLSQAEAVIDIINSKTDLSLESSVNQLNGAVSIKIHEIIKILLELIAHIEASIDYPEYDIEELDYGNIGNNINDIKNKVKLLIDSYDNGKIIHEGIKTVIVGKPNVGKSSLLNNLLSEQRAIVTDVPGTTRDVLEEFMNINGIPLRLMDTAGIRDTDDIVEKIGVSRTKEMIEKADLVIFLLDSSNDLTDEDQQIYQLVEGKKTIILLNKIDLGQVLKIKDIKKRFKNDNVLSVSIKDNSGINLLVDIIHDMFMLSDINFNDQVYITNIRHKVALERANTSINDVIIGIDSKMPIDCLAIDIKNIYDFLTELTGESVSEDIISQIFSQFCLGK